MNDLVARLRKQADFKCDEPICPDEPLLPSQAILREAADRIEYLEYAAALAGAVSPLPPESAKAYADAVRRASDKASEQIEKVRRDA